MTALAAVVVGARVSTVKGPAVAGEVLEARTGGRLTVAWEDGLVSGIFDQNVTLAPLAPVVVCWEPRWRPPVVVAACPSCGRVESREASSWAGVHGVAAVRVTLSCNREPAPKSCWRVWSVDVPVATS